MSNNRRDFLKTITVGTGLIATGLTAACSISDNNNNNLKKRTSQQKLK
ncbi:MAG TPA: twin-arginine translocation signal domain-containing protein [Bacteroidales bacterium]|nr:twin-arginine translocation signal domain-containing protein [Bacteroidales bacterium]